MTHKFFNENISTMDPRVLYKILQIRTDVFVVEQNCPYPELDGRDLEADSEQLWVTVDDEIAALSAFCETRMLSELGESSSQLSIAVQVLHVNCSPMLWSAACKSILNKRLFSTPRRHYKVGTGPSVSHLLAMSSTRTVSLT